MHIHGTHNEIRLHTDVARRVDGQNGKSTTGSTASTNESSVTRSQDVSQSIVRHSEKLKEVPEVRSDVVERATALLKSGELLSRQAAEETAAVLTERSYG